jgi:PEP-CTERM motif
MRIVNLLPKGLAIACLCLALVTPGRANQVPVRGGSTYGDNTGVAGCLATIASDPTNNCEGFTAGTFTIGANTYTGALFVFLEPSTGIFGTLDIIQFTGSSLTLSLLDPSAPTGIFLCGSNGQPPFNVAQDSTQTDMTGLPCTFGASTGYSSPSQDLPGVSVTFSATGVTFGNATSGPLTVFTADGNIAGAIFTPGGTTSTPEPASLVLLGFGALAIGRKFRRAS